MTYDDYLQFCDDLEEAGIFTNGISGETCHMDSYMTCVEFDKAKTFYENRKEEDIEAFCKESDEEINRQIAEKLLVGWFRILMDK